MSFAEGARRRRTPRRGRGSTRDERRARPQVRSERRNVLSKLSSKRLMRSCAEEMSVAARMVIVRDERRRRRAQEKNTEARQRKHAW